MGWGHTSTACPVSVAMTSHALRDDGPGWVAGFARA
jgi:hypothetical protein